MFLLGGTGVGYSVQNITLKSFQRLPGNMKRTRRFLVNDSIEVGRTTTKALVNSYLKVALD